MWHADCNISVHGDHADEKERRKSSERVGRRIDKAAKKLADGCIGNVAYNE